MARDVAEVLGGLQPFEFRLDRVASFDDAVFYLAPTPSDPFVALTNVLWGRFPNHPPFGGQFETIVPHMTLGHTNHGATMQSVSDLLEDRLPIASTARGVTLLVEEDNGWYPRAVYPMGG